jgi:hypothetical protein
VRHVTRRYPDAYFELGQRTDASVGGLADRVFTVCARIEKGRFPFMGRVPFVAFVEEDFEDAPIRYHSFYAKLSVTRELMREDYAFNVRRDPVLRWRDDLHRSVGRILRDVAEPAGPRRWRLKGQGLARPRPEEVVVERLRGMGTQDLERLVPQALQELAVPVHHSRLSNLLAQVVHPPSTLEPQADETQSPSDQIAVRQALLEGWALLSAEERELFLSLARGEAYEDLIARVPAYKSRVAVSRAAKRVGQVFVDRVLEAWGVPAQSASAPPREVLEQVAAVVLPLLSEPQETP